MNLFATARRLCRMTGVLVLGGLLAACGGGGGGGTPTPSANVSPGAATSWAGPYVSSDEGYWALAVSQGNSLDLLAVRHVTASSVVIYSGVLSLGSDGAAAVSGLKAMRADGSLRSGLATLTGVSDTAHSAVYTLNDASAPVEVSPTLTGLQRQPLNALAGNWTGAWLDGLVGSNASIALNNVSSGATVTAQALGCPQVEISFGAYLAASGVYRTTIDYPNTTECTLRRGQSLAGWAWVRAVGASQRLELVAIDPQGSGIVFRADR